MALALWLLTLWLSMYTHSTTPANSVCAVDRQLMPVGLTRCMSQPEIAYCIVAICWSATLSVGSLLCFSFYACSLLLLAASSLAQPPSLMLNAPRAVPARRRPCCCPCPRPPRSGPHAHPGPRHHHCPGPVLAFVLGHTLVLALVLAVTLTLVLAVALPSLSLSHRGSGRACSSCGGPVRAWSSSSDGPGCAWSSSHPDSGLASLCCRRMVTRTR